MTRRYGRFSIFRPLIELNPILVKAIMGQCIIVRAEDMYMGNVIEYMAISDHFDELQVGAEIPEYQIRIDGKRWAFWKA